MQRSHGWRRHDWEPASMAEQWTVKMRIGPEEKLHCSVFPRDHVLLYNKQLFKRS